jgi:putative heme degradation protein
MDKLYIKVIDGVITDHPMVSESVKVLYPDFDGTIIPDGIKEFIRFQAPMVPPFKIAENSYGFDGDKVIDVWTIREKTNEEKQEYINLITPYLRPGDFIDPVTGLVMNLTAIDESFKIESAPPVYDL